MPYPAKTTPNKSYGGKAKPAKAYKAQKPDADTLTTVEPDKIVKPKKSKKLTTKKGDKVTYNTRSGAGEYGFDQDAKWWDQDEGEAHLFVFPLVRQIKNRQSLRRFQLGVHYQAYSNFGQQNTLRFFSSHTSRPLRVTVNVIKSCVDTATARIAKSKPRVYVLPIKGDYELEQKAENAQKFLDGMFQAGKVYSNLQEVFRDACIYGNGALYLYTDGLQILSEQVKMDELIVDEVDAMYGPGEEPQMMYREHWVAKTKLLEQYPDFEEEIMSANMTMRQDINFINKGEWIVVLEAWRKPSTPDSEDGKHVVCINNATLKEEQWDKSYIPIVNFCWTTPLYGFWGQGIALELEALQYQINQTMSRIQKSLNFYAIPRVFIDAQSQMTSQLINDISVNQYSGEPPVFLTPSAMASDVYSYVQWQYQLAFQQVGLSQLSAQSEKPAGLDSAVAMRTYQDVEQQRFAIVGQRWEGTHITVAKIALDMAKDLYSKKSISMKVPGRGFIESVDWAESDLDVDQYDMQCFPTNLLPQDPAGKTAAVQDIAKAGFMPLDVLADQMDLPILNDWVADVTASRRNVKRIISIILHKGRYISPEGILDLPQAIKLVSARILEAECDEVDPERIDLLRRFLKDCQDLLTASQAPPPGAMPPGPPGAPQLPPAPPGPGPMPPPGAAPAPPPPAP